MGWHAAQVGAALFCSIIAIGSYRENHGLAVLNAVLAAINLSLALA